MKALIIGDIHFRLNNPISRKDNIQEAFEDKFNQIKSIIKESDIHYIITTGASNSCNKYINMYKNI